MILITNQNSQPQSQEIFPARAKQMPSKVLFDGKRTRQLFGHCAPKL